MKSFLFRILVTLAGRLTLAAVQLVGSVTGQLHRYLKTRMRQVTRANIAFCFPELSFQEQNKLAQSSLEESWKTIFESAIAWTAPIKNCRASIVAVHGEEAIETLQAGGSGLVFIIPHPGSWELIQHYLGPRYGLTQLYEPVKDKSIDRFTRPHKPCDNQSPQTIECPPGIWIRDSSCDGIQASVRRERL